MVHVFVISSVVRGYHEYKTIWSAPVDGRELPCEREPGNARDTLAVAIRPSGDLTVGHVPRLISAICSIFIRRGGSLVCCYWIKAVFRGFTPRGFRSSVSIYFQNK